MSVMSPAHPDWEAFCDALATSLTVEDADGNSGWDCQHDHRQVRAVLANEWPLIDAEGTIELLRGYQGSCDCEVLLNVADSWENLHWRENSVHE
jgi:hypothetical protein